MEEETRFTRGLQAPEGLYFLNSFLEIDCKYEPLLSLFISSLVLRQFTFTFDVVNVNYVQLTDACDQGRKVETCCAKENIEY